MIIKFAEVNIIHATFNHFGVFRIKIRCWIERKKMHATKNKILLLNIM